MLTLGVLLSCAALTAHGFNLGPNDVEFHLFTRSNPAVSQALLPNANSIATSSFSIQRRTIISIHSYTEVVSGNFNAHLVTAHLYAEDVNVIAVNWGRGATTYAVGLAYAPQVGTVIANFINILIDNFSYNVNQVRIVGVGLGGHIAGIAARRAKGVVPHIIALDPSLIGWSHHPDKLNPKDADVVEVLHTTAGRYGYDYPLGTLDFYPNGGSQQVGCGTDVSCSHIYGYIFYAESINPALPARNKFVGTRCEGYSEGTIKNCTGPRDLHFGGPETKSGLSGIYTFATRDRSPFAQG